MAARAELYSAFSRALGKTAALFSRDLLKDRELGSVPSLEREEKPRRYWIHGASAGELETLWPVACEIARREPESEFVLTVFSKSARELCKKLSAEIRGLHARVLHEGLSPMEGDWAKWVQKLEPSLFLTSKYEAWPELWIALSQGQVPLAIVCAQDRTSLRIARRVCGITGMALPRTLLLPALYGNEPPLRARFPEAEIETVGDPRWDRVLERSKRGNSRTRDLISRFSDAAKPWGVLGSFWLSDMKLWETNFRKAEGTLWVVPHDIAPKNIEAISTVLDRAGFSVQVSDPTRVSDRDSSSQSSSASRKAILVNEMGFLSELYAVADWAYVGGGFEAGVHSTIEPGIQGIPIACGPKNAEKFPEIGEMRESRQLTLARESKDLQRFLEERAWARSENRGRWKSEASARLGASARVSDRLASFMRSQS